METSMLNAMCRCCASEGVFKDVKTSYHWMGEEEIYADMLKDCFDVSLEGETGGICEVCITQLRNAVNFKKQVLHTEEQFKKHVQNKLFKPNIVKVEFEEKEANDSDDNASAEEGHSGTEYEIPIKTEEVRVESKSKKRAAAVKATTAVRAVAREEISSRAKKSRSGTGESSTDWYDGETYKHKRMNTGDTSATPERVEHRNNLTNILQYSNASPFKDKTARGFTCLYCAKLFTSIKDLRAHTAQQSEKDKINDIIDYKLSYNPIKVDITDLRCTVCDRDMKDLNDLKDHLSAIHDMTIYKDIKDIILPFRLEGGQKFACALCPVVEISFKSLYHHMSIHYRNYCCKNCDAGFITIAALRKHGNTHAQGVFPCDYCDKTFITLAKKRNHEKGVHTDGWLRNRCPHCPEIFTSYHEKCEHLAKAHNEAQVLYPCNACNKIYKKKYELTRHIKHHHLQQRSFFCDKCNAKYYSKRGLTDHLSTRHMKCETFSCDVCGKTFNLARTLKIHIRKIHDDHKPVECDVCKKIYKHKSSLMRHMLSHKDYFDNITKLIGKRPKTFDHITERRRELQSKKVDELNFLLQ